MNQFLLQMEQKELINRQKRFLENERLDDDIKGQCFQIHQRQIYGRS